jgi:hypothetical protein
MATLSTTVITPGDQHGAARIVAARITRQPRHMFDLMPVVWAAFEHGGEHPLFSYFPDEISFEVGEFVGLTKAEAIDLRCHKVKQHLGARESTGG